MKKDITKQKYIKIIILSAPFKEMAKYKSCVLLSQDFKYTTPSHVEDLIDDYFKAEKNKRKLIKKLLEDL